MDSSRWTEESQPAATEQAEAEPAHDAAGPVPAVRPAAALDVPTVLALQGALGNAAVARLISDSNPNKMRAQAPAGANPPPAPVGEGLKGDARAREEESRAIGAAFATPSVAALQRQPPTAPAAPAVDPAVAALWHSSVVAPMERAVQKLSNVPITSMQSALDARDEVRSARENADMVAGEIRDNPTLKARINGHAAALRRLFNRITIFARPETVTFTNVAPVAQGATAKATRLAGRLRPASGAGGATSSATSKRIIRSLYQANVVAKLTPVAGRLRAPTADAAVAASLLGPLDQVLEHLRGLQAAYLASEATVQLGLEVNEVGVAVSSVRDLVAFLADGTQPTIGELEADAEGSRRRLAGVFPAP